MSRCVKFQRDEPLPTLSVNEKQNLVAASGFRLRHDPRHIIGRFDGYLIDRQDLIARTQALGLRHSADRLINHQLAVVDFKGEPEFGN